MTRDPLGERTGFPGPGYLVGACWQPAADIYQDREGWLVKFDLAGVAPDDIEVTVQGRRLTVAGVRRDLTVHEGRQAWSMEIAYSRFQRSIELPVDLERAEVMRENRDGMLLVSIRRCGDRT